MHRAIAEIGIVTNNSDISIARRFHDATKYRLTQGSAGERDLIMGAMVDPVPALGEQNLAFEPPAFKLYSSLEPIPLPRTMLGGALTALEAIASTGEINGDGAILDLPTLSHLCLRSNGILKRWQSPSGKEIFFRAAGCTGARYHLELYLVCGATDGLTAGIYHYSALDHTLRRIRTGDYRGNVIAATGGEPAVATAPVVMVCSSIFWRNAWRYQERTYRHVYWDAGTLFTSLLTVAADANLPARVVLGYDDGLVNEVIGLDGEREAAVALIPLGRGEPADLLIQEVTPLSLPDESRSAGEIDFPLIREIHSGSALSVGAVSGWRHASFDRERPETFGNVIQLRPLAADEFPRDPIVSVIERRRSNRHYDAATPLSFELFSTVLEMASHGTAFDAVGPEATPIHDVYLIVNNVEGLESGSYRYYPRRRAITLLKVGSQREIASALACDQMYAADAHVNVYALTDLRPVLEQFGNRGYRLAQIEAALFGGRLQLAAHALGLGAVGSTSTDDEVIAHFSPDAAGKSFMFVAVFGIARKASNMERIASTSFIKSSDAS